MTQPRFDEWIAGGKRVLLGGHEIFHRQDGPSEGRPVTLLHGFPTSSHDWAPIMPALVESGCRVTTLDLLGFGASAKPARHDYRIVEQASIVEELWRHLGIDRTALVAHDYSVSVAQELLHRNAGRITAAAFLNGVCTRTCTGPRVYRGFCTALQVLCCSIWPPSGCTGRRCAGSSVVWWATMTCMTCGWRRP